MPYQSKNASKNHAIVFTLAVGFGIGWAITIAMAVITTFLTAAERVGEGFHAPAAVVTLLMATFAGAMVAAAGTDSGRLIVCLCSGGLYYLSLICCNALFFEGRFQGLVAALLMVLGSCLIAALTGQRQKSDHFKGHKKLYRRRMYKVHK